LPVFERATHDLGAVSLAALVRHLCLRAGMPEALIDVAGLWDAVEGCAITALEAPIPSISKLARHFGFDAIESKGRIRFPMRGRIAVTTITADCMVTPASAQGDVIWDHSNRRQVQPAPRAGKAAWPATATRGPNTPIVNCRQASVWTEFIVLA